MNKRSKVALIILGIFIFFVIISLNTPSNDVSIDGDINEFEEEIVDPNNDLDILGEQEEASNYLLINLANKAERFINKIFDFIISIFKIFVEGIV